jgi:type VI secretion system secreted protein Hcp
MAANYFLNIDENKIAGQSQQEEHTDELEILSFSFGVSQQGGFSYASGGGSAKCNFQDLSVSFRMCSGSPEIMKACASGTHFDKITLTCLKAAGDKQEPYMTIVLERCIISSYQTGGSGDDMPIESMSINFEKVQQNYLAQNPSGGTDTTGTGTYDLATAKVDD